MPIFSLSEEEKRNVLQFDVQDPSITERDIAYLKDWISKQPHLPQEHDDIWLKQLLIACKYSLEKCKRKIDAYFTARSAFPQYFQNRAPSSEDIRKNVSELAAFFIPTLHPNGSIVAILKHLSPEINSYDLVLFYRRISIICDCVLRETPTFRVIIVADNEDFSFQLLSKLTPSIIKHAVYCINKAYPFRIDGFHILNTSLSGRLAVNLFWPFLPEKVKERFHFHQDNIEDLYKYVPKECLPKECGGTAGYIKELNETFHAKVESCRDWFLQHSLKVTDESKRPIENSYSEWAFGMEGSFRQLSID